MYEFADENDDNNQGQQNNGIPEINRGENANRGKSHYSEFEGGEGPSSSMLQPYTQTVLETTRAIAVVQKNFEKLNELYIKHIEDIEKAPEIYGKLFKLQENATTKTIRSANRRPRLLD
jgi:hypothetical protein